MRVPCLHPRHLVLALLAAGAIPACSDGPRIQALPQEIRFGPAPTPAPNEVTATVSAAASSGLAVTFLSQTPSRCAVDARSGLVTATSPGACVIAANQYGDDTWAAAWPVTQVVNFTVRGVIVFGPAPSPAIHDLVTVTAVESAGQPIRFGSATPTICAVDPASGRVSALAAGECTVEARAGEAQASQTFPVVEVLVPSAPGEPGGVSASAGSLPSTLEVQVGSLRAGGIQVTRYTVSSVPPGLAGEGDTLPIPVVCPGSCTGYRVTVTATNAIGTGPASAAAHIVTPYRVVATFLEPDTQPNDSIFVGEYTYDASEGVVSGLRGMLSESMTGGATGYPDDTMTWLSLDHQLSAVPVTLGGSEGWLVTTFLLPTTGTLSQDPRFGGTDGWAPASGSGLHYDFPGPNPGNAYAMIFVNAADPATAATQPQIDRIAYADCAPGGMMGNTCMTGTSVAGYGTAGTMGGHPVGLVTVRR